MEDFLFSVHFEESQSMCFFFVLFCFISVKKERTLAIIFLIYSLDLIRNHLALERAEADLGSGCTYSRPRHHSYEVMGKPVKDH